MLNEEYIKKLKANLLPKKYFSKEQQSMMREVDLSDFLYWYDPKQLVREGNSYRLANNHSVVLYKNIAKDFAKANSARSGDKNPCTAIDFCVQYLGLTVSQGMYVLWEYLNRPNPTAAPVKTALTAEDLERRLQTGIYKRAVAIPATYGYLAGTRKIHPEVIKRLQRENLLYAEPLTKGYNLLFAMRNCEDELVGFESCGVLSNKNARYKGAIVTVPYSSFNLSVRYRALGLPHLLLAFESAIDLVSFLSLVDDGSILLPKNMNVYALSLRGLTYRTIESYIADFDGCIQILGLCVDSDIAGQRFCREAEREWERTVCDFTQILTDNQVKDWNDLLLKGVDKPIDMNDYIAASNFALYDEEEDDVPF